MLDGEGLGEYIDARLTRSAFRLELLDRYDVDSEREEFRRFMAGEQQVIPEGGRPWTQRLRREKEAGILNHRVHVLKRRLTDYLRYECEWGYVQNGQFEDIRILEVTDRPPPAGLVDHDFWLIDDEHAIRMYYYPDGRYMGAEPVPELLDAYRRARDVAVAAAEPFADWWRRHPEEWRANRAA